MCTITLTRKTPSSEQGREIDVCRFVLCNLNGHAYIVLIHSAYSYNAVEVHCCVVSLMIIVGINEQITAGSI